MTWTFPRIEGFASASTSHESSTGYRWLVAWEDSGIDALLTDRKPRYQKLTPEMNANSSANSVDDRWATADLKDLFAGVLKARPGTHEIGLLGAGEAVTYCPRPAICVPLTPVGCQGKPEALAGPQVLAAV